MPRQSAAVYRRRRLAVLLVLILLLAAVAAGVWAAIAQPWAGSAPATQQKPAPDASVPSASARPGAGGGTDPSPAPSQSPGVVACTGAEVRVDALADAQTYAPGVMPKLSISLTNTGQKDCTLNVGSGAQTFTVTSGSDVWWRSTDCQSDPADQIATLRAGETVKSTAPVVWDRTRSSPTTCEEKNRPRAPGGGASYHVSVSIGGFASEKGQQIILR